MGDTGVAFQNPSYNTSSSPLPSWSRRSAPGDFLSPSAHPRTASTHPTSVRTSWHDLQRQAGAGHAACRCALLPRPAPQELRGGGRLRPRRDEEVRLLRLVRPPEGVLWPGVIVEATLAPADAHDLWVVESELLSGGGEGTFVVGDTNYSSPTLA